MSEKERKTINSSNVDLYIDGELIDVSTEDEVKDGIVTLRLPEPLEKISFSGPVPEWVYSELEKIAKERELDDEDAN